jgi:hypothetical protein
VGAIQSSFYIDCNYHNKTMPSLYHYCEAMSQHHSINQRK